MINHFKIFAHYRLLPGIGEKNHRGTEDDGSLKGGRERRGLSSSANSAALRLILELGKNEAVIGGLRE